MRTDKQKAILLRKQGKSYKDVKFVLNIPKSTLSGWLSKKRWSRDIKRRLTEKAEIKSKKRILQLNKIRKKKLDHLYKKAKIEASYEFLRFRKNSLFITGLSIYWGEGDKINKHQVRISNTDPNLVRIFVEFLIKICKIEKGKIKSWILIYPDLDEKECLNFWKQRTGLKEENFTKTIIINGKHKTKKIRFGVCNITVSNRYFKEKMIKWLELLPKYIIN